MRLFTSVLIGGLLLVGCGSGGGTDNTPAPGPGGAAAQAAQGAQGGDGMGHTHPGDSSGAPGCTPLGTDVKVTVKNVAFNTDCLTAPAGTAFTLTFDNQDQAVHNIVFLTAPGATPPLFRIDFTQGPKVVTAQAGPFPAGTYLFHCEVHPTQMFGTFVVK